MIVITFIGCFSNNYILLYLDINYLNFDCWFNRGLFIHSIYSHEDAGLIAGLNR